MVALLEKCRLEGNDVFAFDWSKQSDFIQWSFFILFSRVHETYLYWSTCLPSLWHIVFHLGVVEPTWHWHRLPRQGSSRLCSSTDCPWSLLFIIRLDWDIGSGWSRRGLIIEVSVDVWWNFITHFLEGMLLVVLQLPGLLVEDVILLLLR